MLYIISDICIQKGKTPFSVRAVLERRFFPPLLRLLLQHMRAVLAHQATARNCYCRDEPQRGALPPNGAASPLPRWATGCGAKRVLPLLVLRAGRWWLGLEFGALVVLEGLVALFLKREQRSREEYNSLEKESAAVQLQDFVPHTAPRRSYNESIE
jgi:hypothetical protein